MRLHRLELQAFGPFAERQSVDFDALSSQGLFLLNGPTGAGKSSVLDAVCYAFYGSVPGVRQTAKRLRSDHAPAGLPPEVVCEFSVGGRRFEVTRSPAWDRPAKRGAGTTTEQARTLLREYAGGTWTQKSARNDEAGGEIRALLGMDVEQFTRVVMLAQGDFAAFLRSDAKSRRELLQKLFATDRFETVERILADQAQRTGLALAEAEAEHRHILRRAFDEVQRYAPDPALGSCADGAGDGPVPTVRDLRGTLRGQLDAAVAETTRLLAGTQAAADLRAELESRRTRGTALIRLEEAEGAHRGGAAEIDGLRASRSRHQLARMLEHSLRAQDTAAHSFEEQSHRTAGDLAAARGCAAVRPYLECAGTGAGAGLEDTLLSGGMNDASLARAFDDACTAAAGERGALEASLADEVHLTTLGDRLAELDASRASLKDTENAVAAELQQVRAQRDDALEAKESLERAAGRIDALESQHDDARRLVGTIRDFQSAALRITAEDERHAAAQTRFLTLKEEWLEKLAQRLAQAAAELAAGLMDGCDCPVCGSTEHPRPAPSSDGGLVTLEDEQSARQAQAAAEQKLHAVRADRESAVLEGARLEALGGAQDEVAARTAVVDAEAELEEAVAAREECGRTIDLLSVLGNREKDLDSKLQAARQRIAQEGFTREELGRQHAALTAKVDALRGGYDSIASRVAVTADAHGLMARCRESLRARAEAADQLASASAAFTDDLAGSVFGDAEDVRSALLDAGTVAGMDTRIGAHEQAGHRLQIERDTPETEAALGDKAGGLAVPSAEEVEAAAAAEHASTERLHHAELQVRLLKQSIQQLEMYVVQLSAQEERLVPLRRSHELVKSVADTARGAGENVFKMSLATYVLAARLEQVAEAATERLHTMSDGRYALVHSDALSGNRKSGLGLHVIDGWTGNSRDTATLSGGESFMASLALALGLADVVQQESGGIDIETLFVDEGFGSLDDDALEQVMDALEGLRDGGRVVGLVSHVAELKQRIGAQLQVVKGRNGSTLRYVEVPRGLTKIEASVGGNPSDGA